MFILSIMTTPQLISDRNLLIEHSHAFLSYSVIAAMLFIFVLIFTGFSFGFDIPWRGYAYLDVCLLLITIFLGANSLIDSNSNHHCLAYQYNTVIKAKRSMPSIQRQINCDSRRFNRKEKPGSFYVKESKIINQKRKTIHEDRDQLNNFNRPLHRPRLGYLPYVKGRKLGP